MRDADVVRSFGKLIRRYQEKEPSWKTLDVCATALKHAASACKKLASEEKHREEWERSRRVAERSASLDHSIEELELSVRSYNCLKNANIQTVGDLVQKTDDEMLAINNFGWKSLNEVREILYSMGLRFGMKV
jgi:DNA-directed RNA polymerase alpha subunit